MSTLDNIKRTLVSIEPFNGLPIDDAVWREAHEYHQRWASVHSSVAHRPGILFGLMVLPADGKSAKVHIEPGAAVDQEGRLILVPSAQALELQEKDDNYIVLEYTDVKDTTTAAQVGGVSYAYRVMERFRIYATSKLPRGPHLELARVFRSKKNSAILAAENPLDAQDDEIELLCRVDSFPNCMVEGAIAEWILIGETQTERWKENRPGLVSLCREGSASGMALSMKGAVPMASLMETDDVLMVYAAGGAGFFKPEPELDHIKAYLAHGGFLFAESLDGSSEFEANFLDVCKSIGVAMKDVSNEDALLKAHFAFPSAPQIGPGGQGKLLGNLEKGVVFSSYNLGGAWSGGAGVKSRSEVRDAVEFGINLAAFASQRRRMMRMDMLLRSTLSES